MHLLRDMEEWEKVTNLFEQFNLAATEKLGAATGDKAREKLGEIISQAMPGADDAAAKVAFKLGYLGTTVFLALALDEGE